MTDATSTPSIEYRVQSMTDWENVNADLVVSDPPFGIDFSGKESNYNRDESHVVDGYVEWDEESYSEKISELLNTISENLAEDGQALVFSGWNNSHLIHQACKESDLRLEGKLYWSYNFAPYCSRRPAHNIYEVFWLVNSDDWYYENECSHHHCEDGEANLSLLDVKRDYHKDIPKYPTRLPDKLVRILLDHFSEPGDRVFDPCAGSGIVGAVAATEGRDATLGDLNREALDVFDELTEMYLDDANVTINTD